MGSFIRPALLQKVVPVRLRSAVTATVVALTVSVAPTMAAEAAPKKPTFKVSVSIPTSTADVGTSIRVSGKVSGPRAAKKRLVVQRKVGAGRWTTVRKVTTTSKRRYSTSVKVTTAGAQQFRVVAPASKKARQGVSRTRSLTGWRWLDVSTAGAVENLARGTATLDGRRHAGAWVTPDSNQGMMFATTAGRCDLLTVGVGIQSTDPTDAAQLMVMQATTWAGDDVVAGSMQYVTVRAGLVQTRVPVKRQSQAIGVMVDADSGAQGVMVAPRLHCSLNSLPRTTVPAL